MLNKENKKIKVLIVVMDFWQSGAQRFAFELDNALDKSAFNVNVLSHRDLNSNLHFKDYYYLKHINIGTEIYFVNKIIKNSKSLFKRRLDRLLHKVLKIKVNSNFTSKKHEQDKLNEFLSGYDIVSWVGEYTFAFLCSSLNQAAIDKSIIHIMNAKFQGLHVYEKFSKQLKYTFVSGFDDDVQINYEFSDFDNYEHIIFPLSIEVNSYNKQWYFEKKPTKIGIFTRLDSMKPIDPFLYAFHLILDKIPELELHVFGAGDPTASGNKRITNYLGIESKVFFRGHVNDIVESAVSEKLALVWFQGYKNQPGGFAGLDICLTGIPQIFWEFTYSSEEIELQNRAFPIYKNLQQFVNKSLQLLMDEKEAQELSDIQFNNIVEFRNIKNNIKIIEDLYLQKLNRY